MIVSSEWLEERVLEGIAGRHPFSWLVDEQLLNQVEELLVLTVHSQHVALGKADNTTL